MNPSTKLRNDRAFRVGAMELPVREDGTSSFVPPEQFYIPADGALEKVMWAVANNLPVLLIGETGVGKTLSIRHLAHQTQNGLRRVNLNGMTTVDEFVGKLMINEEGTYWTNGVLIQAMEAGDWILIDEINACLPEIAFCLHSLLDDDRMIVLTEYDGRVIRPHPNFRLFATMNPSEERKYGGTKPLNEALLDRFPVTLRMTFLPEDDEVEAVSVQSGNDDREMVRSMVRCAADLRAAIAEEKLFGSCSTRRVIDWARMAREFGPLESARHTLLSKVSPFDARVIQDAVENYFGPMPEPGQKEYCRPPRKGCAGRRNPRSTSRGSTGVQSMSEVELQTISIHVKVSPEERDRFQVAAQKLGLGLSTWMRMVANAALEPEAEPDEQPTGQ